MNVIKRKLSCDIDSLEILPMADWHIGDKFCDLTEIQRQLNYVREHKNCYLILNGDLTNNATKTSISDCYAEHLTPMEQIDTVVNMLSPIKNKVLAITSGNHEKRTYKKEGIDLTKVIAAELGLIDIYSKSSIMLFLSVGKAPDHTKGTRKSPSQQVYTIYINHGSGGGRKEGSKVNRLVDMSSIIDADIYIHSHTHLPVILKENYYRTNLLNKSVTPVTKLFVNTSSALIYGGYGEEFEYKPNSIDTPIIYLSGLEKRVDAKL